MMILLLACAIGASVSASGSVVEMPSNQPRAAVVALGDNPVKRGEAIGESPSVLLDSILANPEAYAGKTVIVEGNIDAVCPKKGCWMEITAGKKKGEKAAKGIRVTFKDYGFFVPITSQGMRVKAEGEVMVNTLSKEDVEHYVAEGATIEARPDGTALEVTFVAKGVELRKK